MYVPATPYAAELMALSVLAFGLCMIVFQAQPVSRRRLMACVLVMVLGIGCAVFADDGGDIVFDNYCNSLEYKSALWWLAGCWVVDGR